MVLVWNNYQPDLGRTYPMFDVTISQVNNNVSSDINPIDLLPPDVVNTLLRVRNACGVGGLTPRFLSLWLVDGSQFLISYPIPFDENLAQYLTASTTIQAWEFRGEKLKGGRLKKILDNV